MSSAQQTGRAAATSGILMVVGTEGEWLFDAQRDDGTVTNLPVFVLLLLVSTIGFALLVIAMRGLREMTAVTKPARAGAALATVGAVLLTLFAATVLVSSVMTGSPLEAAFIAFLVGMLLLFVGQLTWGVSLARRPAPRVVGAVLRLSGVAAFCALAVEPDPWHDVCLVIALGSWSLLGVLLLRAPDRARIAGTRAAQAPGRTSPIR